MDPNFLMFAVFCLTIIALVAIVYGKPELAEKAIGGLQELLESTLKILGRENKKKGGSQ